MEQSSGENPPFIWAVYRQQIAASHAPGSLCLLLTTQH